MGTKPITCLIIDDDTLFLKVIEVYLTQIPWITLIGKYSNPIEGARELTKKGPDVLLIDLDMPYLDGLEVLETLEKKPIIIMVSGHVKNREIPNMDIKKVVEKSSISSPGDLEKVIAETIDKQL